MTHWRRRILLGVLTSVILSMLFPPFSVHLGGNKVFGAGFNFILSWPSEGGGTGTVDIALLLTEWFAIAIVWGILWILTKDTKTPGIIELALRFIESNATSMIEAARIRADAAIEIADANREFASTANASSVMSQADVDAIEKFCARHRVPFSRDTTRHCLMVQAGDKNSLVSEFLTSQGFTFDPKDLSWSRRY